MSCEAFPWCGDEFGCCPDFDESGKQLNMKCICGAEVPLSSRSSLCQGCLPRAISSDEFSAEEEMDEYYDNIDEYEEQ